MAAFVATATSASAMTTAAFGRFHPSFSSSSSELDHTLYVSGRQRSSSVTARQSISTTNAPTPSSTSSTASSMLSSKRLAMSTDALQKGLNQQEHATAHNRDLSAPLSVASSYSSLSLTESNSKTTLSMARAHHLDLSSGHNYLGGGLDRINLVPSASTSNSTSHSNNARQTPSWLPPPPSPTDQNGDLTKDQQQHGNAPTICTGRRRSNTLTSIGAVDSHLPVASLSSSSQFDHIIRPRRSSLASRPAGNNALAISTPAIPTLSLPSLTPSTNSATVNMPTFSSPMHHYPTPPPDLSSALPLYYDLEEAKSDNNIDDNSNGLNGRASSSSVLASPWGNIQLGFLPRILLLIGIFGLSLGGLYLLAQVLPPLSLPKSIDDVKVDAEILQKFATATYEGWIRTFWVFCAVYIWKQCFGIPGSAFLNILAGALYGPWFGTVLTSLLTTFGSVLAYFMSFFLMEPILNRYASSRLDQMRLQVQKKTMRSSARKTSGTSASATSTAVQTSIGAPTSSSATTSNTSTSSSAQRASLRTRSSSFTVRRTMDVGDQDLSSVYSYPNLAGVHWPSQQQQQLHQNDDILSQESLGLLSEEKQQESSMLFIDQQDTIVKEQVATDEDEEDEEGTSLFMQLLLIRLFPLTPYWFINLASPLVGVPVLPFMTSMFLGVMPYNYICAQAGAILSEIHELRDIYQQPWILFQVVLVLVLCTAAVLLSKRSKKQQLEKEQRKSRTSEDEDAIDGEDEATHRLLRSNFEEVEQRRDEQRQEDAIAMSTLGHSQHLGISSAGSNSNKRDSAVIDMTDFRY